MCKECWINEGSPSLRNYAIEEAENLIAELYNTPDGCCGGYAHIVVDDMNMGDHSIEYCLFSANNKDAAKYLCEETRIASIKCLEYLKKLTIKERYSAMAIYKGYI